MSLLPALKKKKNLVNFPLTNTSAIAMCKQDCGEGHVVVGAGGCLLEETRVSSNAGNVLILGQLSQSPSWL